MVVSRREEHVVVLDARRPSPEREKQAEPGQGRRGALQAATRVLRISRAQQVTVQLPSIDVGDDNVRLELFAFGQSDADGA